MKKIAMFINSMAQSGGIERVTSTLSNIFINKGYDVDVVIIEKNRSCFYDLDARVQIKSLMIEPFKNRLAAIPYYVKATSRLRKYIKEEKPDVIMGIWTNRAIVSIVASRGLKTKVICCEHIAYKELRPALRIIRPLFYKYAAAVVSLTKSDVKYYKKINKTVVAIPNPVPDIEVSNDKREKVILAVGRLVPQKGFDLLLRIWKQIYRKYPDWKLVIVGHKLKQYEKYADELYAFVKNNNMDDSVVFHDHTTKIYDYYKRASIYAMTSRYEGLPMVLLEAMRCGLPPISYDCPTGPKEIIKDEKSGKLVSMYDEVEFIEQLEIMINDERKRIFLGENASSYIKRKYSITNIFREWENLFKYIMA